MPQDNSKNEKRQQKRFFKDYNKNFKNKRKH